MSIETASQSRTLAVTLHRALHTAARTRQQQLAALQPADPSDAVALAHRASVQRILSAIHAAIERLQQGQYGHCEKCGASISDHSLLDRPWTTQCEWCVSR